jgi:hypothetical protein
MWNQYTIYDIGTMIRSGIKPWMARKYFQKMEGGLWMYLGGLY